MVKVGGGAAAKSYNNSLDNDTGRVMLKEHSRLSFPMPVIFRNFYEY